MNKIDAICNTIKILSSKSNSKDNAADNILDGNLMDLDYNDSLTRLLYSFTSPKEDTDEEYCPDTNSINVIKNVSTNNIVSLITSANFNTITPSISSPILLSAPTNTSLIVGRNLYNKDALSLNYISSTGDLSVSTITYTTEILEVYPGEVIKISGIVPDNNNNRRYSFFRKDKSFYKNIDYDKTINSLEFTIPEGIRYIRFSLSSISKETLSIIATRNELTINDNKLRKVIYNSDGTEGTSEDKIIYRDGFFRKVSNMIVIDKDNIDSFKSDIVVSDSSSDTTYTDVLMYLINISNPYKGFCTHLNSILSSETISDEAIAIKSDAIELRLLDANFSTVDADGFIQWFKDNNVAIGIIVDEHEELLDNNSVLSFMSQGSLKLLGVNNSKICNYSTINNPYNFKKWKEVLHETFKDASNWDLGILEKYNSNTARSPQAVYVDAAAGKITLSYKYADNTIGSNTYNTIIPRIISKKEFGFCKIDMNYKALAVGATGAYPLVYLEDVNDPGNRVILYTHDNTKKAYCYIKSSNDTEVLPKKQCIHSFNSYDFHKFTYIIEEGYIHVYINNIPECSINTQDISFLDGTHKFKLIFCIETKGDDTVLPYYTFLTGVSVYEKVDDPDIVIPKIKGDTI